MHIKELIPYLDENALNKCLTSDVFIVPFNPYERLRPNRTIFRSLDIDVVKVISKAVHKVHMPLLKETTEKEVLLQKHFDLSDPIVLFIISIPINLILTIVGSYIYDRFKKVNAPPVLIIVLSREGDIEGCYDEKGKAIPIVNTQDTILKLREPIPYYTCIPNLERPIPIFLEHTSKVVGYAEKIVLEGKGLLVENVKIHDDAVSHQIKLGELIGFSVGAIAKKYECSICHKDYLKCKHIRGKSYNGEKAYCEIKEADLVEISIVSDPSNVDCKIQNVKTQLKHAD
jgi:hypothetical protein